MIEYTYRSDLIRSRFLEFWPRGGAKPYEVLKVDAAGLEVEVTVSPTGRSVQVHVNGEKVWP